MPIHLPSSCNQHTPYHFRGQKHFTNCSTLYRYDVATYRAILGGVAEIPEAPTPAATRFSLCHFESSCLLRQQAILSQSLVIIVVVVDDDAIDLCRECSLFSSIAEGTDKVGWVSSFRLWPEV